MKQLSLIKLPKSFGGELNKNSRKKYRPLTSKKPIHLVFKSEEVLKLGGFKRYGGLVHEVLYKFADKNDVTLYSTVICSNHLHLMVRYTDKKRFQNFLRASSGQIAQKISNKKGFWLHRPFTRITEWGRDFEKNLDYLDRNRAETSGIIEYKR